MAKNRYSDDQTHEVVGDSQTHTFIENVEITNDLTVGNDVTVTGSLTADSISTGSGDLTLAGTITAADITATNDMTADDYNFNTTQEIIRWIPISVIANAVDAGSISGTDTAVAADGGGTITDYPTVLIGHTTVPTWDIYIPVDPFVPNGATIRRVVFYVENITLSAASAVSFQVDVEAFNAAGNSGSATVLGTGTANLAGLTNIRALLSFTVTTAAIDNSTNTGDCIRVKFSQVDATEANTIAIFKMGLVLGVDSISQALGFL